MQRLREIATPLRVGIAFVVAFAFSGWFFAGPYADVAIHGGIVDERFGLGPDAIRDAIDALGADGRSAYRTFLAADMVFPLLHATWMAGFVAIGTKRWRSLPDMAIAAPMLALAFDWAENLCFSVLLEQHPDMAYGVAALAMVAMHGKFAAYIVTFLIMIAIVAWMVMHPVKRGPRPRRSADRR